MTDRRTEAALAPLKDFQRRTVDYVFRRMYLDEKPTRRFLVADEVGLGKTMVARGVIARAIEHLQGRAERINVLYICSNSAIARQNLNRLRVGETSFSVATRLTLLPAQFGCLDDKLNFFSLTVGTSIDPRSSRGGLKEERAVLYRMLNERFDIRPVALRNLLQGPARAESWRQLLESTSSEELDSALVERFVARVSDDSLLDRLRAAAGRFARRRDRVPPEDNELRYEVIGSLRHMLARTCVDALEPGLVIFDEFQRFKDLLDGQSEAAGLARELIDYPEARVLLLSATPYRMFTMAHEGGEDHHEDFLRTASFLLNDEAAVENLRADLATLRRQLFGLTHDRLDEVRQARDAVEATLRTVMCRTERVSHTKNAMVGEPFIECAIGEEDVPQAMLAERISHAVGAGDAVEYWKSAPYLPNFMKEYELKQKLREEAADPSDALLEALAGAGPHLLSGETIRRYERVPFANARLRALAKETVDAGMWSLLWLPPSLPYIRPTGPYANTQAVTKALAFSSWAVVPDVIAALLSFDAERRMMGEAGAALGYARLSDRRKPLLTFRVSDGRPSGMPGLALLYPSVMLARHIDPLGCALELGQGEPPDLLTLRRHIAKTIQPLLDRIFSTYAERSAQVDERWYWAAPALLDAGLDNVKDWLESEDGFVSIFSDGEDDEGAPTKGFERHVDELRRVVFGHERLRRPPPDLAEVIGDFALASPAICAARALRRIAPRIDTADGALLMAAARVATGFRRLFNLPETIELLRAGEEEARYWRRVLDHCVQGNLQSVLDEYVHTLVGATGSIDDEGAEVAESVSAKVVSALSIRSADLSFDEVHARPRARRIDITSSRLRCRFALRFGDLRDEAGNSLARAEVVRDAFNSPFRPFVLASTSIGQEGLDFHPYCHSVWHWNLPSNPVDLEQREGRVHRYKNHAVRRNIAAHFGLRALEEAWDGSGDPWACLFALAASQRGPGGNELTPYWVFETLGGATIERRVPMLPFSREKERIQRLKRSLAVYRLAFGQPRQEDLIAALERSAKDPNIASKLEDLRIQLEPG